MCVFGQLFQTYLFTVCGFVNANSRVSRPGVFGELFFFRRKMAFHLTWDVTAQWLLLRRETLLIQMLGNLTSRHTHVHNKTSTIQRLFPSIIYYYFFYMSKIKQAGL